MPPRHTYWTIIVGDQPTAFRSATQDELLPTLRQLQSKHADAVMKWYARGRLWPSQEDAKAAFDRDRRPAWRNREANDRPGAPKPEWRDRPQGDRPRGPKPEWRDRPPEAHDRAQGDRPRGPKPEWRDRPQGDRPRGPRPESHDRPQGDRPRGPKPEWRDRPQGDRPRGPEPEWRDRPQGDRSRGPKPERRDRPQGDRPRGPKPERRDRPQADSRKTEDAGPKGQGGERRGRDWRPGGDHRDPRDRFKVPRDVKRARFSARQRRKKKDEE